MKTQASKTSKPTLAAASTPAQSKAVLARITLPAALAVAFVYLSMVACAEAQIVRIGQSTILNGISKDYGLYGQVETTYQGQFGYYAFWQPAGQPIHVLTLPTGSLSGIDKHCMAGNYTNESGFNISGFQQCRDNNGNWGQFHTFDMGANATLIFSQVPGSEAVAGFYDNGYLHDTGFIATPVLDGDGNVVTYTIETFTVPEATSTQLLVANQYGIGGSFENAQGNWVGFLQRTNGPLETFTFPGATQVEVTAINQGCVAGKFLLGEGNWHGFFRCKGDPIPFDMGYGGTFITEITDDNILVGYAQDPGEGTNFGFIWDGATKTLH
jgi:hypothetical protein